MLLLGGKANSAEPLLASYPTLEPKLYQVLALMAAQSVVACDLYIVNCPHHGHLQQLVDSRCFGRRTRRPISSCIRRYFAGCL